MDYWTSSITCILQNMLYIFKNLRKDEIEKGVDLVKELGFNKYWMHQMT